MHHAHFIVSAFIATLFALTGCKVETVESAEPAPQPQGGETVEVQPAPVAEPAPAPEPAPVAEPEPTPAPAPAAEVHAPIRCAGREAVALTGVSIDGANGPAIQASGNCNVTCTNCTIRSAASAIQASGNANVALTGGTLTGAPAITASGNANVNTTGTTLQGDINRSGRAAVANQ